MNGFIAKKGVAVKMPLTADDVLVGILHELRKEVAGVRLTTDRQQLHTAFAELQKRFAWMTPMFSFRQREAFPESPELDQALSNLDATGLISRYNQTPRYYTLGEGLDVCYDTFSKHILDQAGIRDKDIADAANGVRASIGVRAA